MAAAASEPEANERGSSLISRRLHYRRLQSLFLAKRMEFWSCASGTFRMRSGMQDYIIGACNHFLLLNARNCGYARMRRFTMRSISKSRLTKGHEFDLHHVE